MRTLRVIVVEDQAPAREHLVDLVSRSPLTEVVAVCHDGPSAVSAIRSAGADVVLLDIEMPELNGFQVIEAVGPQQMPAVVFITAYHDHAVRAFDVRALDYLLKPFTAVRVERALDLAREHIRARLVSAAAEDLAAIVAPAGAEPSSERLELRRRGQVAFVAPGEVEIVVARRNNVLLYTRHDEFTHRATLSEIHAQLGDSFVKIHRSTLVNFSLVQPTLLMKNGVPHVRMAGGRDVRVSKAFRSDIQRRLRAVSA